MATNFRDSSGTDFDDLFDPYVTGTVPPNTAFRTSDGVDLAGRYAPLSYGSKRADVNYRTSAGTDLSNLWAQKGSAIYTLGFNGQSYSASAVSGTGDSSFAALRLTLNSDGTWTIGRNITTPGSTYTTIASGTWLPSGGSAADYSVVFAAVVATHTNDDPVVENGAPSYASLATTRTVTVSLSGGPGSENSATGSVTCTLKKGSGTGMASTFTWSLAAN